MKIVHVGNHTFPCVGGVENVIWHDSHEQAKQGHEVTILVFNTCTKKETKLPSHEKKENLAIIRVPQIGPSFYRIPPIVFLLQLVRKHDVVHIHGFGPWLDILCALKPFHQTKMVLSTHGGFFHSSGRKGLKLIYNLFWLPICNQLLDGVIYDSDIDKKNLPAISRNAVVIQNGSDVETYDQIPLTNRVATDCIFVGRLSSNKRVSRLLEVLPLLIKKNKRVHFHIVSVDWDETRAQLEKKAETLGVSMHVTFYEGCTGPALTKIYQKCGVFVSASDYEGFGISTIDAMAAGCVPCLNDIPTFREFVEKGVGYLTNFNDLNAAAEVLTKIFKLPTPTFRVLQKKARLHAQSNYSWGKVASMHVSFYERLMANKG